MKIDGIFLLGLLSIACIAIAGQAVLIQDADELEEGE